jgi:hypothetical protein
MNSTKLKSLLLLLGLTISTALFSQTAIINDSTTCLPNKKLDFLITGYVKSKALEKDTAKLHADINDYQFQVMQYKYLLRLDSAKVQEKTIQFNLLQENYSELWASHEKTLKINKRYKKFCLIVTPIAIISTALFIFK